MRQSRRERLSFLINLFRTRPDRDGRPGGAQGSMWVRSRSMLCPVYKTEQQRGRRLALPGGIGDRDMGQGNPHRLFHPFLLCSNRGPKGGKDICELATHISSAHPHSFPSTQSSIHTDTHPHRHTHRHSHHYTTDYSSHSPSTVQCTHHGHQSLLPRHGPRL